MSKIHGSKNTKGLFKHYLQNFSYWKITFVSMFHIEKYVPCVSSMISMKSVGCKQAWSGMRFAH